MALRLEPLRTNPVAHPAAASPTANAQRLAAPPPAETGGAPFPEVLRRFAHKVDSGERLVRGAVHGNLGALDAGALIAVQAGIYHYTEAIELAGKLVDRATGAVRQVLQPNH